MASDLSVPKVGATAAAVEAGRVRVAGQPPRLATVSAPPADPLPDTSKPMANPTLRLDPGLALVVIEFRDGAGKVRETIPTEAQLDAYRASQRSSNAPVPLPGQANGQGGADGIKPVGSRQPAPGEAPPVAAPRAPDVAPPPEAGAAQPRGPADSAVPGLPVKASETGTA
jgi:hypothetical protein